MSLTTDGVAAAVGCRRRFITLCKKHKSPEVISYRCINREQGVSGRVLHLGHNCDVKTKIIASIRVPALSHRLLTTLLADVEDDYEDLILHTEDRWLSKGKVPLRLLGMMKEIKFLKSETSIMRYLMTISN